jgi:carbamoyltransferase
MSSRLGEILQLQYHWKKSRDAANLAYVGQQVFIEVMTELLTNLYPHRTSENLVLTGGCALNSAYNGQISERTPWKNVFVYAAPGDDGNAMGAALLAYAHDAGRLPTSSEAGSPYLGTEVSDNALKSVLQFGGLEPRQLSEHDLLGVVARMIADGKIIGWMQGRAELGPRALGNRSILADPRRADMKDIVNERVKFREEFRPFAPSILEEHGPEYFENYQDSPYMERALRFRPQMRDKVPAVVHVDGTGRLQSVSRKRNQLFYDLIERFYGMTGVPVLLNTSFNVMGKPIVHSVDDALVVYFTSGLDALVIGNYVFEKPRRGV